MPAVQNVLREQRHLHWWQGYLCLGADRQLGHPGGSGPVYQPQHRRQCRAPDCHAGRCSRRNPAATTKVCLSHTCCHMPTSKHGSESRRSACAQQPCHNSWVLVNLLLSGMRIMCRSGTNYSAAAKKPHSSKSHSASPLQPAPHLARGSVSPAELQQQQLYDGSPGTTPPRQTGQPPRASPSGPPRRVAFAEEQAHPDSAMPKVASAGSVAALAERFGPVVKAAKPSVEGAKLRSASADDTDVGLTARRSAADRGSDGPQPTTNGAASAAGRPAPVKHGSEPLPSTSAAMPPPQPPAAPG